MCNSKYKVDFTSNGQIPFEKELVLKQKVKKFRDDEIYKLQKPFTNNFLKCELNFNLNKRFNIDIDNAFLYNFHLGKKFLKGFDGLMLKINAPSNIGEFVYTFSVVNKIKKVNAKLNCVTFSYNDLISAKNNKQGVVANIAKNIKNNFSIGNNTFGLKILIPSDLCLDEEKLIKPVIDYYVCSLVEAKSLNGKSYLVGRNNNRLNPPDYLIKELIVERKKDNGFDIEVSTYDLN